LGNLALRGDVLISQNESKLSAFDLDANGDKVPSTQSPVTDDQSTLTAPQLIAKWSSDAFAEREAATLKLLALKHAAIPALAEGSSDSNREIAFRSSYLLAHLLDANDSAISSEARYALLAAASRKSQHSYASNAYAREAHRRSQQSILDLENLGAIVKEAGTSVTLPPTWQGQNDGLSHLAWLSQLETLELRHSAVKDSGLTHLRGLPNLKSLNLNRSKVTNDGLQVLRALPKLETLLLQGTQIDDGAIAALASLKQLKAINLTGTKFTTQGVEQLRLQCPNLKIVY
jgi:Leucine-rich repeat (LRR) protein